MAALLKLKLIILTGSLIRQSFVNSGKILLAESRYGICGKWWRSLIRQSFVGLVKVLFAQFRYGICGRCRRSLIRQSFVNSGKILFQDPDVTFVDGDGDPSLVNPSHAQDWLNRDDTANKGIRGNEAGRFDPDYFSCIDFLAKRPASFPLIFTKIPCHSESDDRRMRNLEPNYCVFLLVNPS